MGLQTADYVVGGLTLLLAVLGLFRGLSGTLGFIAGAACAVAAGTLGWNLSPSWTATLWIRIAATAVVALLTYGIVRWAVKRMVNGLLHQPTDSLCGFLVGVMTGMAIVTVWAYSGLYLEYSILASNVADFIE